MGAPKIKANRNQKVKDFRRALKRESVVVSIAFDSFGHILAVGKNHDAVTRELYRTDQFKMMVEIKDYGVVV